jgi:hypothetical protein
MQAAFEAYSQVLQLEGISASDVMIRFAETDLASFPEVAAEPVSGSGICAGDSSPLFLFLQT